jgi:hypothetical protein
MYIYDYSDFLLEKEMKNWEKFGTEQYWDKILERVFLQLEKAFEVGGNVFLLTVKKIMEYFKSNPKILVLVISLLIGKYQFNKYQLKDVFPKDATLSLEDLYQKFFGGEQSIETNNKKIISLKGTEPISVIMKNFLNEIAKRESSSDPEKINSKGYMGKYQFGKIALKDILQKLPGESNKEQEERISKFWPSNFGKVRTSSDFNLFQSLFKKKGREFWPEHKQDLAMQQLLKNNKFYLGNHINKWVGKEKNGVKITLSGLLAGSHLLGPSNVKKFLDSGKITKDGYGTPITEYIEKFGGYDIKL